MLTRVLRTRVVLALAAALVACAPSADAKMGDHFDKREGVFRITDGGSWTPWIPFAKNNNGKAVLRANVTANGFARLENHAFTPEKRCTGDWAEVMARIKFCGQGSAEIGDGQLALRIADMEDRQVFMVLSGTEWVAVGSDGVEPAYDREYVVNVKPYYSLGMYTVSINGRALSAFRDGTTSFAMPQGVADYGEVRFDGVTGFKCVRGDFGTQYPCAWTGDGNGKWMDAANWADGKVPSDSEMPSFVEGRIASSGTRTVIFDEPVSINNSQAFVVAAGTQPSPVVFQASSADSGLTVPRLELGLLGLKGRSVLCLKGGTYNFTGGAHIGADAAHTGRLVLGGGSVPTSVSFLPWDLVVKPGSSLVGDDASLSASNFYLSSGECGAALTNVAFTTSGGFYVCQMDGATGVAEKVGGDWTVAKKFSLGDKSSNRSTFRHLGGSMATGGGNSKNWFSLGVGRNSTNEFYNLDGTLTVDSWFLIGCNADSTCGRNYFEVSGGTVSHTGGGTHVVLGYRGGVGTTNELRVTGGTFNARQDIFVGGKDANAGGYGLLAVDGGEVNARSGYVYIGKGGIGGDVALMNGGSLATKRVLHGGGEQDGSLMFDGGTLVAAAGGAIIANSDRLVVAVDEGGGTIDNGGFNVTLAKSMEGTGSLELTGSGVTTFTTNQLYTGATKIAEGTGIKSGTVNIEFAGTLVLTNGSCIVVVKNGNGCNCLSAANVVLPPDGTATVSVVGALPAVACPILTKTDGCFRAADLVKFSAAAPTFHLALSSDRKSICIVPGGALFVWTGAYDNNLLDNRNWSGGAVPSASGASTEVNAVIGVAAATTLVCNGEFSPTSIVFPPDSAQVTISGTGRVTNVCEIANLAADVHHVFNVPVTFADGVEADVTLDGSRYMRFPGGLTARDVKKGCGTDYYGKFNFTRQDIDWSEKDAVHVLQGSVTMNGALNASSFGIYTRKSVYVNGDMPVSGEANTTKQLVWRVYGRLAVSNLITLSGGASLKPAASYGYGAYAAKGLYNGSTGKFCLNTTDSRFFAHWEIGESGLAASENSGGFYVYANSPATLNSLADYTISAPIDSAANAQLKIGTENVQDRTITVDGELKGGMSVELSGSGTVAFNSVSTFTGGLVASNGVTLALGPGAKPGNGTVSMRNDTTLDVRGSAEISGALAMSRGAAIRLGQVNGNSPSLTVGGEFSVVGESGGNISVKIGNGAIAPGTYTILSASNISASAGDFVLEDLPSGYSAEFTVDGSNIVVTIYASRGASYSAMPRSVAASVPLAKPVLASASVSVEVEVRGIRVLDKTAEVEVALVRSGAELVDHAPISGTLRLYSVDIANGTQTLVEGAVADDPTFANGDTTTVTFETSVPAGFYRVVIEDE